MRRLDVDMDVHFTKDGDIIPRAFVWENGRQYEIDRVLEIKKAASLKAGGQGIRYTCRVMNKTVYLFLEDGKQWFLEGK